MTKFTKGRPRKANSLWLGVGKRIRNTLATLLVLMNMILPTVNYPVATGAAVSGGVAVALMSFKPASAQVTHEPWYCEKNPDDPWCPGQDCGDGKIIGANEQCPVQPEPTKTCWDGSVIPQSASCPAQPEPTKTCWDGSVIPQSASCPAQPEPTKTCWDGSVIPQSASCPAQPEPTKTCWDGSVIPQSSSCPAEPAPTYTCWNGQVVSYSWQCPAEPLPTYTCWNGDEVNYAYQCPAQPVPVSAGNASLTAAYNGSGSATVPVSGSYSSVVVTSAPAHGTASFSGSTLTYSSSGYIGPDSLTYTASGTGGTASGTVSITVSPPPAPTAGNSSATVPFEGSTSVQVVEGGYWTTSAIVTPASHGTASISGKSISYQAATNYEGADYVEYSLTGPSGTATGRVDITVSPAAVYTVTAQAWSVGYNTPYTASIASVEGPAFGPRLTGTANHGAFEYIGAGGFRYTPAIGFVGQDVFPITWTGPTGKTSTATMTVTVAAPALPTVAGQSVNTAYNTPVSFDLSAGGVVDGFSITGQPGHGVASLSGNRVTYTPATSFYGGSDTIKYKASNVAGESNEGVVTVNVGVPGAPSVAGGSMSVGYESSASMTLVTTGVVSTYTVSELPAHGSVVVSGGSATYSAAGGYIGPDSFKVKVSGPGGASGDATVSVSVLAPAAPGIQAESAGTSSNTPVSITLHPTGLYGQVVVSTQPSHGHVTIAGETATYTPEPGFDGSDQFEVQVSGPGGSATAVVTISVVAPQSGPVVANASIDVEQDSQGSVKVSVGGEYASIVVSGQGAHGVASVDGEVVTYKPDAGYVGADTVEVVAVGPGGTSQPATIKVTVTPKAVKPVAEDQVREGVSGEPVVFHVGVRGNVAAPTEEGGSQSGGVRVSVELVTQPSVGSAEVKGMDVIYWSPADYRGRVDFTYRLVSASGLASAPASLTAILRDVPVAAALKKVSVWAGKPARVELSDGATGGPFSGARIVSVSQADAIKPEISIDGGKITLLVTPIGTFSGVVSLEYVLINESGESAPGVVEIEMRERPDPSLNAGVRGIVNAQAQSATRFGVAQLNNIERRLEAIRAGLRKSGNGVTLSSASMSEERVPGFDRSKARDREMLASMSGRGVQPSSAGTLAISKSGKASGKNEVSVWSGGVIEIGSRSGAGKSGGFDYNTSGVSVGADIEVGGNAVFGIGVGAAKDASEVGSDGTRSDGRSYSAFMYGSLRPTEGMFVDAVLGYGSLQYDSRRWSSEAGAMLFGSREGDQVFGSIQAGIERQLNSVNISPYGRMEYVSSRLGAFSEVGDDTFALRFEERSVSQLSGVLGFKGDMRLERRSGTLAPSARAEYRWALSRSGLERIHYADWAQGKQYQIVPGAYGDNRLTVGVGLNWLSLSGWSLSGEVESAVADKAGSSTTVRVSGGGKF